VNVGRARRRLLLLRALGGGSRLLSSIFEDLESLVNLEDEVKELLSGVLRLGLRLLSIHAMNNQEREGGKRERKRVIGKS